MGIEVLRALESLVAWYHRRSRGFRERCDQKLWKHATQVLHDNFSLIPTLVGTEPKPRACVGCGHCCLHARCAYSWEAEGKDYKDPLEAAFHEGEAAKAQCPQLYWNGTQWRCKVAKRFKRGLAIGEGCCQELNAFRKQFAEK